MSKKIFCLALALMMLVCSTAFATSSKTNGSVSSGHVSSSGSHSSSSSATVEESLVLEADPAKDAVAQAVLATLLDAVAANGGDVAKAFGADVEAALTALGIDVATLDVATLFGLTIANYDATYGDVVIAFDTTLADDINVVASVLGVVNGADITWCVLDAESAADGKVNVTFTQEVLSQVPAGADTVLAILTAE